MLEREARYGDERVDWDGRVLVQQGRKRRARPVHQPGAEGRVTTGERVATVCTMGKPTASQYRREIQYLVDSFLGALWVSEHLGQYGGLSKVPPDALPGLYALARLDAAEVAAARDEE